MPEAELPTYVKGQHLRGIDATIVERVSVEMVRRMAPCVLLPAAYDAAPRAPSQAVR